MTAKNTFSTNTALLYAVAAFRINNNKIERENIKNEDISIKANRNIIQDALKDQNTIAVLDSDQEEAAGILSYLEQISILRSLSNQKTDSFLQNIIDMLTKENVSSRDIGLLAWAPKVAHDYRKKEAVRETSSYYERTSQWVGTLKDKITVDLTLIDARYNPSFNATYVYAHDKDGNLFFYWASDKNQIGKTGRVQGRIKAHIKDKYRNGARVTKINYVKIV